MTEADETAARLKTAAEQRQMLYAVAYLSAAITLIFGALAVNIFFIQGGKSYWAYGFRWLEFLCVIVFGVGPPIVLAIIAFRYWPNYGLDKKSIGEHGILNIAIAAFLFCQMCVLIGGSPRTVINSIGQPVNRSNIYFLHPFTGERAIYYPSAVNEEILCGEICEIVILHAQSTCNDGRLYLNNFGQPESVDDSLVAWTRVALAQSWDLNSDLSHDEIIAIAQERINGNAKDIGYSIQLVSKSHNNAFR
jgi:hypothetical protein